VLAVSRPARGRRARPGRLPRLRGACRAAARATVRPPDSTPARAHRAGSRPALRGPRAPAGAGRQPGSGRAGGSRRQALARAELAQQLGGGLVRDAEPGAQRVAGDRLPLLVLVLGGGPPRRREQRLVPALCASSPASCTGDGRPGADGLPTAPSSPAMRRGRRAARRSIIETATRNAAGGTAATIRPQAVGWAWARLAARLSSAPPASTTAGHDSRLAGMPACLSRWRSRVPIRSMHTATAQDIGPPWPCCAAVSRMWVNEPAPAITASTVTGRASATVSRRRPALTSRPAVLAGPDGPAGRPRPRPASRGYRCGGAGPPR
jgi:hypothetical protein